MPARRLALVLALGVTLSSFAGCDDPPPPPPPAPLAPTPPAEPPPVDPGAEAPPAEGEGAEPAEPEGRTLSAGTLRVIEALPDDVQLTFVVARHLPDWYQGWERAVDVYAPLYREAGLSVRVLHPSSVPERAEVERLGVHEQQREVSGGAEGATHSLVYHRGFAVRLGDRVIGTREAPEPWWLEYEVARRLRAFLHRPLVLGVATVGEGSIREATDCLLDRYEVRQVDLAEPIEAGALSALVITQPSRRLTEAELQHVSAYLDAGGSVGIFGANVQSRPSRWPERRGSHRDVGLGPLLEGFGIAPSEQMVAANMCSQVGVQVGGIDQLADFRLMPQAIFAESGVHPALDRGTRTRMPFAGAFTIGPHAGVTQDLVINATEGWLLEPPTNLSPATRDEITAPEDGTRDDLPLLAFLRRGEARLVFAGSPFFRDDLVREDGCFDDTRTPDPNPRVPFVRIVDWLALDLDLVDIGAPAEDQPLGF